MAQERERYKVEVNGQIEEFEDRPGLTGAEVGAWRDRIASAQTPASSSATAPPTDKAPPGFFDSFLGGLGRETGVQDIGAMVGLAEPSDSTGSAIVDMAGGATANKLQTGLGFTPRGTGNTPPRDLSELEQRNEEARQFAANEGQMPMPSSPLDALGQWSPEDVDPRELADAAGGFVGMSALPMRAAGAVARGIARPAARVAGAVARPFVGPTAGGAAAAASHLSDLGDEAAGVLQGAVRERFPGMPMSSEDAAKAFEGAQEGIAKASRDAQQAVFREIDSLSPNVSMDVGEYVGFAQDMVKDMTAAVSGKSRRQAKQIIKTYPKEMQDLYGEVRNLVGQANEGRMSIRALDAFRDRAAALARQHGGSPQFRKLAREGKRLEDQAISAMAKDNPRLDELWTRSKGFRKGAKDSTVLAQLASTDPEAFASVASTMRPARLAQVGKLLENNPELMGPIARKYVDDLVAGGIGAVEKGIPRLEALLGKGSGAMKDIRRITDQASEFTNAVSEMDQGALAMFGRALNQLPAWARIGGAGALGGPGAIGALGARQLGGWLAVRGLRDPKALKIQRQLTNALKSGEPRRVELVMGRIGRMMTSALQDEGPEAVQLPELQ